MSKYFNLQLSCSIVSNDITQTSSNIIADLK